MPQSRAIDARAEVYADLQKMIHQLVHRFCRRYSTNVDEYLSLAHLTFLQCFETFDAHRSRFSTYVYSKIQFAFLEQHRRDCYSHSRLEIVSEVEDVATTWPRFSLIDVLDELTTDGREVVDLLFSRTCNWLCKKDH